jgi:hypothetical protein
MSLAEAHLPSYALSITVVATFALQKLVFWIGSCPALVCRCYHNYLASSIIEHNKVINTPFASFLY